MKVTTSMAALSAACAFLAPSALGSDPFPLYWVGPQGEGILGAAGDVNGDDLADVVLGSTASPTSPQQIFIRSGADGSLLHVWAPSLPGFWAYHASQHPAGDLDSDGLDDVALTMVGPSNPFTVSVVEVHSAVDGSVMGIIAPPAISQAYSTGLAIAGAADMDGDGLPELLVSGLHATGCMSWGQGVYNFEAPGFALQHYNTSWQCAQGFGTQVGPVDDVDGDGLPDYYVGAWATDLGSVSNSGWIGIFSGAAGTLITSLSGTSTSEQLGVSVAALSDVTGDGLPEIAVLRFAPNVVQVLSLPTFSTVHTLTPSSLGALQLRDVQTLGDSDGDGVDDLLVRWLTGAIPAISEKLTAISGATGSPIGQVGHPPGISIFAFGPGDVNGDGLGDVAVPYGGVGGVYVARNFDLTGPATAGGAAQFQVVAPKHAGRTFQLAFSLNQVYPPLPLGPFLFTLAPDALFWASLGAGIGGTLDPTGHGSVTLPIPNDPALPGLQVQASGVVYDPAGPLGIGCVLTQLPVPIQ